MKITGYTIWKPLIITSGKIDLKESNSALIIFLKAFPDLEKEFFSGNEFWINPTSDHIDFLKRLIIQRLDIVNSDVPWENNFSEEEIEFLKKSDRIIQFEFLGKAYELNTFGNSTNIITLDLISLYNMLQRCVGKLGLKITPEK